MNTTDTTSEQPVEKNCATCGQPFACEYPALARYVVNCAACVEKQMAETQHRAVVDLAEERRRKWQKRCPPCYAETDVNRLPLPHLASRVLSWRYGPRGLLLHGATGLGKSRCAWLLLRREYLAGRIVRVLNCEAGIEFAARYADGTGAAAQWIDLASRADLLLLDDVFKAKLTDSFEAALFTIVATRGEGLLPILVTTNDAPDSLAARLSQDRREPLLRRLRELTEPVSFTT